ncbi:hypothetical protein [Caballeronia novacaledonica]|uniref:D-alanyl-D-alanine carboxypeptidase family protein n=1 Tax=Caballeronia novacaledonica TaxID=1544861 RepID=A0AA37MUZ3_9BURK|nr:hypothetical protein [Caballeronia novacaledonica]GJH30177.1 D-alanyl-D-alanine carboxypeptidase family protein [Caballeronia novacaledonica]
MKTPLLDVDIPSIYKNSQGVPVQLPKRLARATPDMTTAMAGIAADLSALTGRLVLSDLFRTYDMQMQAHLDYVNKKKRAFSPPPGGSFHEGGRAMDLSLPALKMSLDDFWVLAKKHNVVPIISQPNSSLDEAWHFECRGSHQVVIDYYRNRAGSNFKSPYAAGAASAILAIGVRVDQFGSAQKEAQLQAALIRCGHEIGNLDGAIGVLTRAALTSLGLAGATLDDALAHVEDIAQKTFRGEYKVVDQSILALTEQLEIKSPGHVVLDA